MICRALLGSRVHRLIQLGQRDFFDVECLVRSRLTLLVNCIMDEMVQVAPLTAIVTTPQSIERRESNETNMSGRQQGYVCYCCVDRWIWPLPPGGAKRYDETCSDLRQPHSLGLQLNNTMINNCHGWMVGVGRVRYKCISQKVDVIGQLQVGESEGGKEANMRWVWLSALNLYQCTSCIYRR
jgi:hypothetical protein